MQYAVEVLKVKHVVVCGHDGCGGVAASMGRKQYGLIDNGLRHIKDVYRRHAERLDAIEDFDSRVSLLCKLDVQAQVQNVCHTTIVQNGWKRGQGLTVHGVIYALQDGLLQDLDSRVTGPDDLQAVFRME